MRTAAENQFHPFAQTVIWGDPWNQFLQERTGLQSHLVFVADERPVNSMASFVQPGHRDQSGKDLGIGLIRELFLDQFHNDCSEFL